MMFKDIRCSELYQRQGEEQVAGGLGSLCCAVVRCHFCRQNQLEHLHTHTYTFINVGFQALATVKVNNSINSYIHQY